MTSIDTDGLLQRGIDLAKAVRSKSLDGKKLDPLTKIKLKKQARETLAQVVEQDENNLLGWLWLSSVIDNFDDRRLCLENALTLDPYHRQARLALKKLEKQLASQQSEVKLTASPQPTDWTTSTQRKSKVDQPECPFCHQAIVSATTSCPNCKLPLLIICPECDEPMEVEWSACSACAQPLGDYQKGADYFMALANQYENSSRLKLTLDMLRAARRLSTKRFEIDWRISEVQLKRNKIEAVVTLLNKLIKHNPKRIETYLRLGQAFEKDKNFAEARKTYRRALAVDAEAGLAHLALGELLLARRNYDSAQKHLKLATKFEQRSGRAWALLGLLYDETEQLSSAVKAYEKAKRWLSPDLVEYKDVTERLEILSPDLPLGMNEGWPELIRQLSGPMLICVLALLLDSGLRPWWIHWTGCLAVPLAALGALFWVSGSSLPQNPIVTALTQSDIEFYHSELRPLVAAIGIIMWLAAMGLIFLPFGQSFPEFPFE